MTGPRRRRVLVSWSSGKDSAWMLHVLRQNPDVEVVGLLTTFDEATDRVGTHDIHRALVDAQAAAAGLPIWPVHVPVPCSNDVYEERMAVALRRARGEGVTRIAFGDLFLKDVRDYRVRQLRGSGVEPRFPLWCDPAGTRALAHQMLDAGLRAVVTCVDPKQLSETFAGRPFDAALLDDLPPTVDPCGERGEFHTFCFAGPMFTHAIPVATGAITTRDGFVFADVRLLAGATTTVSPGP